MRLSYKIGSLFGFPIRLHISLLIFLGFVFASGNGFQGLIIMVAVFGSVVFHELGHALVARSRGMPIVDISLYPFGGMARMAVPPKTSADEIRVALAGPLVSLLLALGFWLAAYLTQLPSLWILAKVNLMLGVFNMLPALPMDGGRVLRAFLSRKMGFFRATTICSRLARWMAVGIAVIGLFSTGWLIVLAAFLMFMAFAEEGAARARQFMGDPGYQDAPAHSRPTFDPFQRFTKDGGVDIPGSEWEVLDEDEPEQQPDGPQPDGPGKKVYRDRFGNRIVVEWRDG